MSDDEAHTQAREEAQLVLVSLPTHQRQTVVFKMTIFVTENVFFLSNTRTHFAQI